MQVFISGSDTNIGKTIISSWLCLHLEYEYFKPIQTGGCEDNDSQKVFLLSGAKTYPESYLLNEACSPQRAAAIENKEIQLEKIMLPSSSNLIVEGAGGLLVPLNRQYFIIDLIKYFSIPTILVSSSRLGTINHTLLSLEALKKREIEVLGVIIVGEKNISSSQAIEFYGDTRILMEMPLMSHISKESLKEIPLSYKLNSLFNKESTWI